MSTSGLFTRPVLVVTVFEVCLLNCVVFCKLI